MTQATRRSSVECKFQLAQTRLVLSAQFETDRAAQYLFQDVPQIVHIDLGEIVSGQIDREHHDMVSYGKLAVMVAHDGKQGFGEHLALFGREVGIVSFHGCLRFG